MVTDRRIRVSVALARARCVRHLHRMALGVCLVVVAPAATAAETVQVPLSLSQEFLEAALRERVFGNGAVRLNDDGTGCQFLELSDPRVTVTGGRVLLTTAAAARAGRKVGGRCLLMFDWRGSLEFDQRPSVTPDGRGIVLQTASWRALRADGSVDNVSTTIGTWIERFLPLGIRQTTVDLGQPLSELEAFVRSLMGPAVADTSGQSLLERLRLERVGVTDNRVAATLALSVAVVGPQPSVEEPVLTQAELIRLEQHLDDVDAFVTYTIRSVIPGAGEAEIEDLLAVLLELRLELVGILGEPRRSAEDPARRLFVDAWNGLVPVLRHLLDQQPDSAGALRFASFIAAGDALRALDRLGPAAGIEVSSDGLRRMARILLPDDPDNPVDPLERSDGVDPELRRSFGFGEPLPPPQFFDETTWLDGLVPGVDWLIPQAHAGVSLDPSVPKKLNNWVPKTTDMDVYLPMVRDVLRYAVDQQLKSRRLQESYQSVFRSLVLAAAWQESCWRQFVAKNDKRVPMQSGTGDVGMMQINPKVWRGFYDLQGLRWDIVYNARSGADILEHHLLNYGIKNGEQRHSGGSDNLARAGYAAYNGGPRQYDRYRRSGASARDRKVDGLFYAKFREIKAGRDLAVMTCYEG